MRNSSLDAPFLDPRGHQRACTRKRPVSRGEAHSAYNSGGDEAPFTSGVPHHTPPDLAVFSAPPLSHTHSRREPGEGRRLRDGEMLIIRGRQPTRHIPPPPPSDIPIIRPPPTQECYLPQAGSSGQSGRGRDSSPGNSPSRTAPEPGQRNMVLVDSLNQPQGK